MNIPGLPSKQGLYDPEHEKDQCRIAIVGNIVMVEQENSNRQRRLPR